MGTTWSARVVVPAGASPDVLQAGIQAQLDAVDAQMSTYRSDSSLSQFNVAAAETWVRLTPSCFDVVERAIQLAADTGGAYDPTVGPLVNLWGFGPDGARHAPPPAQDIERVRARVGWHRLQLDRSHCALWQPGDAYLDLSSIAKGYSVDGAGAWLDHQGVSAWLVEVGGEFKGRGSKPDGSPWRVGVEQPDGSNAHGLVLALRSRALATSGSYRRFFESHGRRHSHHIDPRTGHPTDGRVASVSVLAASAFEADPLGTAMTILGPEDGLAYAAKRGLAVYFILHGERGFEECMSPAFADALRSA